MKRLLGQSLRKYVSDKVAPETLCLRPASGSPLRMGASGRASASRPYKSFSSFSSSASLPCADVSFSKAADTTSLIVTF